MTGETTEKFGISINLLKHVVVLHNLEQTLCRSHGALLFQFLC